MSLAGAIAYVILAPLAGAVLAGADRIISARMQGRVGPPVLQPLYDALKLFSKKSIVANHFQNYFIFCFLVFIAMTGALFFAGGDLLLTIFALTVAGIFLAIAAYSPNSPYSNVGAERELLQMMAYEPMLLMTALGMYLVTGSFQVGDIVSGTRPVCQYLPGILLGFLFVLTIKLRKSPFDLSTSHHGHQELVKGLTTEMSGPSLALVEIAHWYENILLLGFIYLFFAALGPVIAVVATLVVYLVEIVIDNASARLTWKFAIKSAWIAAGILGATNILVVYYQFREVLP
jgi:formate hydrogenlyase subunit 4